MEFVLELILTAFIALVFSFIVANIVSMVMGCDATAAAAAGTDSTQNADSETTGEDLKFDRGLKMESNTIIQCLPRDDVKLVDKFDDGRSLHVENPIASSEIADDSGLVDVEESLVEKSEVVGLSAGRVGKEEEVAAEMGSEIGFGSSEEGDEGNMVTGSDELFTADSFEGVKEESTETVCLNVAEKIVKTDENGLESMGSDPVVDHGEEIKVEESEEDQGICGIDVEESTETVCLNVTEKTVKSEENGAESIGSDDGVVELGEEIKIEENRGENSGICGIDVVEKEKKDNLDSDEDDDWEGIERSELENVFFAASNYVLGAGGEDRLPNVDSDVHLELCGLHKVAMEGPCHEPQPMALKVSARAKWNAWQRLGNMNPEVAMEKYITILSEKVPGWMNRCSAGDGVQEDSSEVGISDAAPDFGTCLHKQPISENASKLDRKSGSDGVALGFQTSKMGTSNE